VVSRAAKLLGCRLYRDRSRTSCRPHGGLARSRLASRRCPRRAEWLERGVGAKPEVRMPFAHADDGGIGVRPKRRCALMEVLIGVDPHKGSLAVAALDEATGELLERAGFAQNRAGLRSLERWAKRFPERRWAVENAGGLGVGTWRGGWRARASRWWTCRPSFRHGYGCSLASLATPARTTSSMPWPPRLRPRATSAWRG
jgi:hypothetical protein